MAASFQTLGLGQVWLLCLGLLASFVIGQAAVIQSDDVLYESVRLSMPEILKGPGGLCWLPERLDVTISMGELLLHLRMSRNPRVTQDALHFLPHLAVNGTLRLRRAVSRDSKKYAFYHDTDSRSALVVTCPEEANAHPEVEGTLFHEGRRLSLRARSQRYNSLEKDEASSVEYELVATRLSARHQLAAIHPDSSDDHEQRRQGEGLQDGHLPSVEVPKEQEEELPFFASGESPDHVIHRREVPDERDLNIDVMAIIAYDLYKEWYDVSEETTEEEKRADAIEKLRKYFAIIMSEVDLHYQNLSLPYGVNIRLVGYIIADTPTTSPWTESLKEDGTPYPKIDAQKMLSDLQEWVAKCVDSFTPADYYILFSRYNQYLKVPKGKKTRDIAGLAYRNGVCPDPDNPRLCQSCDVAVVEVHGLAETVFHTVHEIAHGLGANHDGDGNDCTTSQNYVMRGDGDYAITDENAINHGHFSSCSAQYIHDRVRFLSSSPKASECLHDAVTASNLAAAFDDLPGRIIEPDDQCRLFLGELSHICTSLTNISQMCLQMYCYDPLTSSRCRTVWAARGTSCGDKKWCVNGRCLHSDDAPNIDETCVLGDVRTPPVAGSNKTCAELFEQKPSYCYHSGFHKLCCRSCSKKVTDIPGCEYGDEYKWCLPSHCPKYAHLCCKTCHSSEAATTTTITAKPTTTEPAAATTQPTNTTTQTTVSNTHPTTPKAQLTAINSQPTVTTQNTITTQPTTTTTQPVTITQAATTTINTPTTSSTPVPSDSPPEQRELIARCRETVGEGSVPCMYFLKRYETPDVVCEKGLYCSHPDKPSQCYSGISAAPKTPCGDKKWCMDGKCVYSPDAPDRDPNCVFGDQMGRPYPSIPLTCAQMATSERGYCHYPSVRSKKCCHSCAKLAARDPDCPFGDYPDQLSVRLSNGTKTQMACPQFAATYHWSCSTPGSSAARYCCLSCRQYL